MNKLLNYHVKHNCSVVFSEVKELSNTFSLLIPKQIMHHPFNNELVYLYTLSYNEKDNLCQIEYWLSSQIDILPVKINVPVYCARTAILADIYAKCLYYNISHENMIGYVGGEYVSLNKVMVMANMDDDTKQKEKALNECFVLTIAGQESECSHTAAVNGIEEGYEIILNTINGGGFEL